MRDNTRDGENMTVVTTIRTAFDVDDATWDVSRVRDATKPNVHAVVEMRVRSAEGETLCDATMDVIREELFEISDTTVDGETVVDPANRDRLAGPYRLDADDSYEPLVVVLRDVTLHANAAYRRADEVLLRNVLTVAHHHLHGQVDAILYDTRRDRNRTPNAEPRATALRLGYEPVPKTDGVMYLPKRTFRLTTVVPAY